MTAAGISRRDNDAITANPSPGGTDISINVHGSDWLWAVFAAMLLSDLVMIAWMFTVPVGRRVFHHMSVLILTTASIAYFSMASNLGQTPVLTEFNGTVYRALWYARYIDWVITTPALLLTLLLATGLPLSDIIATVFFDEVMIVSGLIGGLVASSYKWGYFAFGMMAEVYIWWILLVPALKSSTTLGPEFRKAYMFSAIFLSAVWALYPVAWGLADGANVISPDAEMIFYGILDLIAKPVFTFFHVFMLSKVDYTKLQLQSGKFSEGANTYSTGVNELDNIHGKNARANATAADPRLSTSTAVQNNASVI